MARAKDPSSRGTCGLVILGLVELILIPVFHVTSYGIMLHLSKRFYDAIQATPQVLRPPYDPSIKPVAILSIAAVCFLWNLWTVHLLTKRTFGIRMRLVSHSSSQHGLRPVPPYEGRNHSGLRSHFRGLYLAQFLRQLLSSRRPSCLARLGLVRKTINGPTTVILPTVQTPCGRPFRTMSKPLNLGIRGKP